MSVFSLKSHSFVALILKMLRLRAQKGVVHFFANFNTDERQNQQVSFFFSDDQTLFPLNEILYFNDIENASALTKITKAESVR